MRLIDKDALLDQLKELLKNKEEEAAYAGRRESSVSFDDAITTIKNAPTIEQEPQWIPCSERLPDDCKEVLIYLYDFPPSPYIAWVDEGIWQTDRFEVEKEYYPIAWMPLPEPYDGDKND